MILAAAILVGYLVVRTISVQSEITVTCSGNGCPGFGQDYLAFVNYTDFWALTYRAYLQSGMSTISALPSGSYSGRGPTNESIYIGVAYHTYITTCFRAQKMDNSDSPLILRLFPDSVGTSLTNATSVPYGIATICIDNG